VSALAQLPSPIVRADTPEISKNPMFFLPKSAASKEPFLPLVRKMYALDNTLPLTADDLYGQNVIDKV